MTTGAFDVFGGKPGDVLWPGVQNGLTKIPIRVGCQGFSTFLDSTSNISRATPRSKYYRLTWLSNSSWQPIGEVTLGLIRFCDSVYTELWSRYIESGLSTPMPEFPIVSWEKLTKTRHAWQPTKIVLANTLYLLVLVSKSEYSRGAIQIARLVGRVLRLDVGTKSRPRAHNTTTCGFSATPSSSIVVLT